MLSNQYIFSINNMHPVSSKISIKVVSATGNFESFKLFNQNSSELIFKVFKVIILEYS